jgi:Aerotolerance regulator N-terminal
MTLLSGWALAGLLLVAPLVFAHLRRESRPQFDVPSLLLWQDLEQRPAGRSRKLRLPRLPLLLALQALALILLVFALARPTGSPATPRPTRIFVLDDSLWMSGAGRLPAARARIGQLAAALPRDTPVRLILAGDAPQITYSGPAAGIGGALRDVRPAAAPSSLGPALTLAAALLTGPRDTIVVARAPETPLPPAQARPGELSSVVIGSALADQGIFSPTARCGISTPTGCEVIAPVDNTGPTAVTDRYTAYAGGAALSGTIRVGAGGTSDIVLTAAPGEQVRLSLDGRDALAADNQAWVTVPGPANTPPSETVTLVGAPSDAVGLARAFAAVPGVTLRLRTPATYRAADGAASGLTVLDGWIPARGLPGSPGVLLVNPPRLPGGRVTGTLRDSVASGLDPASGLLTGVDLTSLSIDTGGGRALTLPPFMSAVAWSPDGPLLAAGDDGRQRVAVISFDPAESDLPQLESFPILAANLVQWSAGWTPTTAAAGRQIRIDATPGARRLTVRAGARTIVTRTLDGAPAAVTVAEPGLYQVAETGPGVSRSAAVAVSIAPPVRAATGPAIDLAPQTGAPTTSGHGDGAITGLLAAALLVLVAEWFYWRRRAPRLAPA